MHTHSLKLIYEELEKKEKKSGNAKYFVPSLWAPIGDSINPGSPEKVKVNPCSYYKEHIHRILNFKKLEHKSSKDPVSGMVIYNSFVRATAAFDHNGDGAIGGSRKDITLNKDGIRETGTFLKTIAQLGHMQRLGCNCLYLLPVTKIGKFGNKGNLGSPYAIKNPYEIDKHLEDPLINAGVDIQFKALVEACHLLGIKVILEFVFRTASRDSDFIELHPDWFYWIDAKIKDRKNPKDTKGYGNPIFGEKVLKKLKKQVAKNNFNNLPEPSADYINFYYAPPKPGNIKHNKDSKVTGASCGRDRKKIEVSIPGAFADWPPDDVQPPWGDVTYLRMYKYKKKYDKYNYMAYNTIRMYEKKLAKDEYANKLLWQKIEHIMPHYQNHFHIDGVLVDMGHAMPKKLMNSIIKIARNHNKDFVLLSENFHIGKESKKQGYHAVMGFSWGTEHDKDKVKRLFKQAGAKNIPIKFLATGENHNTPRSASRRGGINNSKNSFLINAFIPNGILFVHSGYELAETYPVNTGLDFTPADIKKYKGKPLGLFDITSYNWLNKNNLIKFMQDIMYLRDDYNDILMQPPSKSYKILDAKNKNIMGFVRYGRKDGKKTALIILINYSGKTAKFKVDISKFGKDKIYDYLNHKEHNLGGKYFKDKLKAYEGRVYIINGTD
ncbi:MAG: alpha-amylase family glycosyl hydrolase [Armatimonadota bacterium]